MWLKIWSFRSLHFIRRVYYNVGGGTIHRCTVINLWLYRVEINEPQYVITYAGNEHAEVVEIHFSSLYSVEPLTVFEVPNFARFDPKFKHT